MQEFNDSIRRPYLRIMSIEEGEEEQTRRRGANKRNS
jgi:hypothetical protein